MVQTSNEQSRTTYVETRGSLTYYNTEETQEQKGWFWCNEKKGLFRYSDWHKTKKEIGEKYGINS